MSFYISSEGGYSPAWGSPTSTLNFCEEDYQFTPYIAELFNTLTNVTYILLGVRGIINSRTLSPAIGPLLPYAALISLGIASSAFHSTLLYPMQMYDEFSMLIATFIVFFRLMCVYQTAFTSTQLFVGLVTLMTAVVVAQVMTADSTWQQIVFTGMAYWLWRVCFQMIDKVNGNDGLRRKMNWMAISGIAFFVTGHICWMTDFYACSRLRSLRRSIGMPWAATLEFHGYWHIFTGIGVYIFMVLVECLRVEGHGLSWFILKGAQIILLGIQVRLNAIESSNFASEKQVLEPWLVSKLLQKRRTALPPTPLYPPTPCPVTNNEQKTPAT